jgi:hypothetical protein
MFIHPDPPLRSLTQEAFDKLQDVEKKQYNEIISYEGCRDCKLLSQCKTRLAHRPQKDRGKLWKKIQHTINLFRSMSPDMATAQLLCFNENAQVMMADGASVSIKNIKIGDSVITHTGKIKKVTELFQRHYSGDVFEINHTTWKNSEKLLVTPEHPYFTDGVDFTDLKDIQPFLFSQNKGALKKTGQYLSMPKNYTPELNNEIRYQDFVDKTVVLTKGRLKTKRTVGKDVPEKYILDYDFGWILGYFMAEGFYSKKQYPNGRRMQGITFCSDEREAEYHKKVFDFAHKLGLSTSTFKAKNGHGFVTHIYNNSLAELIVALCGEYSDQKKLHPYLMNANLNFLKGVLEGFDSGDGDKRKCAQKSLTTTSYVLASQMFLIAARLGYCPRITKRKHFLKKQPYNVIYNDNGFVFSQKKTKFKTSKDYNLYRFDDNWVTKVKYTGIVYNIEVEDDHSYIVNGLAVHNCRKPSLSGLVYPRFDDQGNTMTIKEALSQICEGSFENASIADVIAELKRNEIKIYVGGDWGSTACQAFVVSCVMPGGDWWILDAYAISGLEFDDVIALGEKIRDTYSPVKWFMDTNQPMFIKAFNKRGMKCQEFKKDVAGGIECVRTKIINATGVRKLKVLKHERTEIVIEMFRKHHFILDSLGKPTDSPDDGEAWSDVGDSMRYLGQNLFGNERKAFAVSSLTPNTPKVETKTHLPTINHQIMQNKVKELASQNTTAPVTQTKGSFKWNF